MGAGQGEVLPRLFFDAQCPIGCLNLFSANWVDMLAADWMGNQQGLAVIRGLEPCPQKMTFALAWLLIRRNFPFNFGAGSATGSAQFGPPWPFRPYSGHSF